MGLYLHKNTDMSPRPRIMLYCESCQTALVDFLNINMGLEMCILGPT